MPDWSQFVFDAYANNTKNLCEHLRSRDCSLTPIQRGQVAELIERKISRKTGRGPRRGKNLLVTELREMLENSAPAEHPHANEQLPSTSYIDVKRKSVLRYKPRTSEMLQRRLRISSWALAVTKAKDRDIHSLCEYLRSADLPLDHEQLEDLSELIDRKINLRLKPGKDREAHRGRKPGRFTPLEEREGVITTRVAVAAIKRRRRKFGKMSGVSVEEEVESFASFCSEAGDEVDINKAKAVASIRRGKRRSK